jgi:hypothetical protein
MVPNSKCALNHRQVGLLHVTVMLVQALVRLAHVEGRRQYAVVYRQAHLLVGLAPERLNMLEHMRLRAFGTSAGDIVATMVR